MDKNLLLKKIAASLCESLEVLTKAAQASRAEATHESSNAENKYDTRGLEAAYLAGGQARQAKEIMESIELYQSLPARNFAADEPVDLGAWVEVESDRARAFYFIGPKNGGLEVEWDGREITVITPQSPLGRELMGKKAGQRWMGKLGGTTVKYRMVKVE